MDGSALERGVRFLLAEQGEDGLWRDFCTPAGVASAWPSGVVGIALHRAEPSAGALEHAADALLACQGSDGGWGYNETVPSDADSTACALHFLAMMGWAPRTARQFLIDQLRPDGGVATYGSAAPIRRFMGLGPWVPFHGWCQPHAEVTASAGRALAADGQRAEADRAWAYVRSQRGADGAWQAYWWTAPHYATHQAVELAAAVGDDHAAGGAAVWALRAQRDDGGWGAPGAATSAFATALCVSILVRAGAERGEVERAAGRLSALQQADGGWPSHPIMRIPLPGDRDPDRRGRWRPVRFASGITVADQHRTFTSAACVAALAQVRDGPS